MYPVIKEWSNKLWYVCFYAVKNYVFKWLLKAR